MANIHKTKVKNKKYYKKALETKSTKTSKITKVTKKENPRAAKLKKVNRTPKKEESLIKKENTKKLEVKKINTNSKKESIPKENKLDSIKLVEAPLKVKSNENKIQDEKEQKIKKLKTNNKIKTKFKDEEQIKTKSVVNEAFKKYEEFENSKDESLIEQAAKVAEGKDLLNKITDVSLNKFIVRLIILLIIAIFSIFLVVNFSIKYMTSSNLKNISYFESSDIEYEICTKDYCIEDTNITNNIEKVKIKYSYDINFDEKLNYNTKYYIKTNFNIYNNENKILYKDENDIFEKEEKGTNKSISINKDIELNISEYRDYLNKYNKEKNNKFKGKAIVTLYLEGIGNKKNIGSITIPLQEENISKSIISSNIGDINIKEENKTNLGGLYVFFTIISLIILIGSSTGVIFLLNTNFDIEE